LSISVCWPSSSFRKPRTIAPTIGPTSVPRPPTIVQMMTPADWPRLNTPGVTISAQFANRHPGKPGHRRADREDRGLVERRAVAEQLDARSFSRMPISTLPKNEPRIQRQSR
jgi:hypothetical protein